MLEQIVEPLLIWYEKNKRSLPWRDESTPYHVWTEIMLTANQSKEAVKRLLPRL